MAQQLQQLRQQRNNLQDRYLAIGSSFNFEKFQATLDDRTAILEWYITHVGFLTFIVTRQSPQPLILSFTAEDLNDLIAWTNAYLEDYYRQKGQWFTQLASRLEQLAKILHLDEIFTQLPDACDQLILIPPSISASIPAPCPSSEEWGAGSRE